MRTGDNFLNKPKHFTAMIEYLINFSNPGDAMVQNSLETSSDKNTPHLQFIPGDVPLPLFYEKINFFADSEYQHVDWYLPTLVVTMDSRQTEWQARTEQVQEVCQQLLINQNISTTPVFKNQGEGLVALYLIFKQDGSHMTPKAVQLAPGWLESCGIFIADTSKAELLSTQGAQQYYKPYGVVEREQLFATICDSLSH